MNSTPSITIIMPVYNREKTLPKALESISAQTDKDFEVVLVDNNSTDGSKALMGEWAAAQPFKVRVVEERKQGASAARARGADVATTEWLRFFDSDDELVPDHVARLRKAIAEHPDAELIGWDIAMHYSPQDIRRGVFKIDDIAFGNLMHGYLATERYAVTAHLYRRAGGWNTEVGVWDDIELGARLIEQNPKMVKIEGVLMVHNYVQADSLTQNEKASKIDILDRALNRMAETLGPDRAHWIDLKRMIVAALSPGSDGKALRDRILSEAKSHRTLLRIAYAYTSRGGRGTARILRRLRLI
ncbi:MAG: glycosyltransferase family 2 protein [Bacteroidales bacterium]|nr:glycosyltransferase family 2 protein [Bacteroidales bacterium]